MAARFSGVTWSWENHFQEKITLFTLVAPHDFMNIHRKNPGTGTSVNTQVPVLIHRGTSVNTQVPVLIHKYMYIH